MTSNEAGLRPCASAVTDIASISVKDRSLWRFALMILFASRAERLRSALVRVGSGDFVDRVLRIQSHTIHQLRLKLHELTRNKSFFAKPSRQNYLVPGLDTLSIG